MEQKNQIWIDTGGTFTDCIIQSGNNESKFVKVLSDGSIRGQLTENLGNNNFRIKQNWHLDSNIISGYKLYVDNPSNPYEILDFDPVSQILQLDHPVLFDFPCNAIITAHEEAPILAIRIGLGLKIEEPIENIELKLGTTKGTNALLEGKGARVCLICTKGFSDLSIIGTQQRPDIFQIDIPEPQKLFSTFIEIEEQVNYKGEITKHAMLSEVDKLNFEDIDSIAIAFKNSYANSSNENSILQELEKKTKVPISLSSHLSSEVKLLNRTQSTLINAYLDPILNKYFNGISHKLSASNLAIMSSTGTLVNNSLFRSMDSLLSGPAGGLKGAVKIGSSLGYEHIITFDMGGTSTDVARYNKTFDYQYRSTIGGFETSIPSLSIETVAAGGGSICYFEDGQLKIGPQSAGAHPGPAAYGMGGPLTITDVNLLLGKMYLNAFQFPLFLDRAEQKLSELCKIAQLDSYQVLAGLEQIANQKMSAAIRKISIRKGFNPNAYAMVSFGGAGGLHACKIAESLNIKEIIFPYASGLLSAFGIGHSSFEKIFSHSILETVFDDDHSLHNEFETLANRGIEVFKNLNYKSHEIHISKRWITISVKGQEGSLDIEWNPNTKLKSTYLEQYRKIFGFLPDHALLEIQQIHVLISEYSDKSYKDSISKKRILEVPSYTVFNKNENAEIPVFTWEKLGSNVSFRGPAILYNEFGSVYLEKDWEIAITEKKQAIAKFFGHNNENIQDNEAVNLAIFSNRFQQISEEMGEQLQKTAFSVNIKERLDFSCGILNKNAFLVSNAPHIPVHLGSLGMCGRLILEKIPLEKGDIIITNHPKYGGSHLPDITLLMGVFDEKNELLAYLINRAHHAEIGGSRPGSMPPNAKTLEEEGVVFVPQYLAKTGVFDWKDMEIKLTSGLYPSRSFRENIADIKAGVASLKSGESALLEYCHAVGKENVLHYMDKISSHTRHIINESLKPFESQNLNALEFMDDGRKIKVSISKQKNKWIFDFTGTDSVHPGNLNANASIVHSAILYVLRLLVNRDIPLNEGLMEDVKIILPESFLNPKFHDNPALCPAVVGGNTEVSQRLVDTLLKAFGIAACSQGTMNNLLFGNERFGYYETICGGTGASKNQPGRSAVHQHMTNTRITDPEDLERNYPVVIHEFSVRKDSGGNGKHQGGNGIVREIEFLEQVEFTLISQHRNEAPYGLNGGENGKCGNQKIIRKAGKTETLDGIDQAILYPGDRIKVETPGGGGWGVK